MKKPSKENYVTPTISEYYIELESGIAAGSGNVQAGTTPTINEEEGTGGSSWEVDGF